MRKWETIARVEGIGSYPKDTQLRIVPESFGSSMQIQALREYEEWQDITEECSTVLVKSRSSSGYYIAIQYSGTTIGRVGFEGVGSILAATIEKKGFQIKPCPDAHISFRIFKSI